MSKLPFPKRQRTVENGVLRCVKFDGECLASYERLVMQYWTIVDRAMAYDDETGIFKIHSARISHCTSPESIDRAFRTLVKRKVLQLSEEDQRRREKYEKEYREYHSPKNGVAYWTEGMEHWKET